MQCITFLWIGPLMLGISAAVVWYYVSPEALSGAALTLVFMPLICERMIDFFLIRFRLTCQVPSFRAWSDKAG